MIDFDHFASAVSDGYPSTIAALERLSRRAIFHRTDGCARANT
jgi:hypothetical protein